MLQLNGNVLKYIYLSIYRSVAAIPARSPAAAARSAALLSVQQVWTGS